MVRNEIFTYYVLNYFVSVISINLKQLKHNSNHELIPHFLLCHPYLSFLFIHCKIGKISGVVSERDYVCKIALLGKTSKETKVKGMS